jgi:hypothetical protein
MPSSLTEQELIPRWAKQRGLKRCFVYSGPSMRTTFQPGQLLYVHPDAQTLRPGDVLVYHGAQDGEYVVHRLVGLTPGGWLLRGDNNRLLDAAPVPTNLVIGRVEWVEGPQGISPVRGGPAGMLRARLGWLLAKPWLQLRRAVGWPYRALRSSPAARRWLRRRFGNQVQTVRLVTSEGPLVKSVWRGQVVARWSPALCRYECRKPFDLFLDPPS